MNDGFGGVGGEPPAWVQRPHTPLKPSVLSNLAKAMVLKVLDLDPLNTILTILLKYRLGINDNL